MPTCPYAHMPTTPSGNDLAQFCTSVGIPHSSYRGRSALEKTVAPIHRRTKAHRSKHAHSFLNCFTHLNVVFTRTAVLRASPPHSLPRRQHSTGARPERCGNDASSQFPRCAHCRESSNICKSQTAAYRRTQRTARNHHIRAQAQLWIEKMVAVQREPRARHANPILQTREHKYSS